MKPTIPWSVKGVEPEAREAAKAAARRAGMTLGQWLNHVIQENGQLPPGVMATVEEVLEDEPEESAPEPARNRPAQVRWEPQGGRTGDNMGAMLARMENLEARQAEAIYELGTAIEAIAERVRTPEPVLPPIDNSRYEQRLAQLESEAKRRIDALTRELQQIASRHNEALTRHDRENAELSHSLNALAADVSAAGPSDRGALSSLRNKVDGVEMRLDQVHRDARAAAQTFERAVGALADRMSLNESRQREQAQALERTVATLTDRVSEAMRRDGSGEAEAVRALESAVGEITRHFETIEDRRQRTQRTLEDALNGLAQRLADSDRRQTAHMRAPLEALDKAVSRNNERIVQAEDRTAEALGTLNDRLGQLNERFERSETEFKASRLALMRALDDAARRLDSIERRPVADVAAAPSDFSAHLAREPQRETHPEPEPGPRARAEEPEIEDATPPERAVPERKSVSSLLAEARQAARAERSARGAGASPAAAAPAAEATGTLRDILLDAPAAGLREAPSEEERRRAQGRGFLRSFVIFLVALVALGAGYVVWERSQAPASASGERPDLVRSLIDAASTLMRQVTGAGPLPSTPPPIAEGIESAPLPEPGAPDALSTEPQDNADGLAGESEAPTAAAPGAPSPESPAPNAMVYARTTPSPAPDGQTSEGEAQRLASEGIALAQRARTAAEAGEAARLISEAARLGDSDAQFALGRLYEVGRGLAPDGEAARRWYEAAAAQGNRNAAYNLGNLAVADGTSEGYSRGALWFLTAAQRGHRDAQYNLGVLYARGLGLTRNPVEAFAWFEAAAEGGDPQAAAERDRIGSSLDPAARAQGEALARARSGHNG